MPTGISVNVKDVNDLSGSSIYVKDITELSDVQQKNFLNCLLIKL